MEFLNQFQVNRIDIANVSDLKVPNKATTESKNTDNYLKTFVLPLITYYILHHFYRKEQRSSGM